MMLKKDMTLSLSNKIITHFKRHVCLKKQKQNQRTTEYISFMVFLRNDEKLFYQRNTNV